MYVKVAEKAFSHMLREAADRPRIVESDGLPSSSAHGAEAEGVGRDTTDLENDDRSGLRRAWVHSSTFSSGEDQ